ncbi:hypothetical protein F2Q68_00038130 [Brassica cretica]|uniref:Uncharacterized protein n=1 Tax=Brassica cretica TaxID=69181 RepID=A0A8S9GZ63_BRACR|nr:hypothetical protein F2Q68_00038130 [Brassica cretica]
MGRSPPCCEKAHTNKGAWTKEEDERLIAYIKAHGEGCWRSLPKAAGLLRCGKSCRLRWINYLRPDLKRGNFSEEEDALIIKLHSLLGNKGIDPTTHRPVVQETLDSKPTSNSTINISFTSSSCTPKVETLQESTGKSEKTSMLTFKEERDDFPIEEKLPDLNLELSISLPPDVVGRRQGFVGEGNSTTPQCFRCSSGMVNGMECRCGRMTWDVVGSSSGKESDISNGFDFVGLAKKETTTSLFGFWF